MRAHRILRICLALYFLCFAFPATAQTDPSDLFQQGVTASRAGDYQAALRHFEAARKAGMDTPQLHYNLGVSYRRTNDNESARRAFRAATRSPELAGPAYYQLGLMTRAEGNLAEARQQFRQAERAASTERLRKASRVQLTALDAAVRAQAPRGLGYIAIEGGYDDNVASVDETAQGSTESDLFGDFLAWGEYRLTPEEQADVRINGTFNTRFHPEESEANLLFIQGGVAWHQRPGQWRTRVGTGVSEFQLDGSRLERMLELVAGAERAFQGLGEVRLRARSGLASGGEGFEYLDGYRQELRLGLHRPTDTIPWFVRYQVIYEDRDDQETSDGGFQSASPLRQAILVGIRPVFRAGTRLDLTARYRVSRFADPDRLDNGETIRRKDDQIRLSAGVLQALFGEWDGAARVSWTDNDSNRDGFDYDRVQLSLGVERTF